MGTSNHPSRGWWKSVAVAAILLAVPSVRGAATIDLSGAYADEGTLVSADPTLFTGEVSLHALLRLEFEPRLVAVRRDETAEVRFKHDGELLAVESVDAAGTVSWKTQMHVVQGVAEHANVVVARLVSGREEFILLIEPVKSELIQIKVQRLTPSVLGPMVRSTGIYLFARSN